MARQVNRRLETMTPETQNLTQDDSSGIPRPIKSNCSKEICCMWGSMVADMASPLTGEVKEALKKIGLDPLEENLTTNHTQCSELPDMTLPALLVTFGCCVLVLFKDFDYWDNSTYETFMTKSIRQLQESAGHDTTIPDVKNPFSLKYARLISNTLGEVLSLRARLIKHLGATKGIDLFTGVHRCLLAQILWSRM